MANVNTKIHGIVSVEAKPVQTFKGIVSPVFCRTIIARNADGTTFEFDLFGDTAEALDIKGGA